VLKSHYDFTDIFLCVTLNLAMNVMSGKTLSVVTRSDWLMLIVAEIGLFGSFATRLYF